MCNAGKSRYANPPLLDCTHPQLRFGKNHIAKALIPTAQDRATGEKKEINICH
jgi:hypothetical protein